MASSTSVQGTLVLAELTISADGVVTGVAAVDSALKKGGGALDDFDKQQKRTAGGSDLLTERMFSLRHAVVAALGGFTLAGVILGLKSLLEAAIQTNSAFGTLSASFSKFSADLLEVLGNLPGVSEGLKGVATWLDRIDRVLARVKDAEASGGGALGATGGVVWRFLFGQTSIGQIMGVLDSAGKLIDKVLPPTPEMYGPPAPAGYGNEGYNPDATQGPRQGPPGPQGYGDLKGAFYDHGRLIVPAPGQRVDEIGGPLNHAWPEIPDSDALDRWQQALDLEEKSNEWFEKNRKSASAFETNLKSLVDTIDSMSLSFDIAVAASQAFANALTEAAVSGSLSAKKMIGEIIQAIGQAIIAYGTWIMAEGWATWDPSRIARGIAFVAAGAATIGIGARLAGEGGNQGAGAGAAAAGSVLSGGSSTRSPANVTVNVAGSLFGTSKDQLAREFVRLWERGVKDMGGGAAVVARAQG